MAIPGSAYLSSQIASPWQYNRSVPPYTVLRHVRNDTELAAREGEGEKGRRGSNAERALHSG
eukprot:2968797-Rhodomonas_salina.2